MSQPITVLEMDQNQRKQERKKKQSELAENGLNGAATLLRLNLKRNAYDDAHGSQLLASTLPFLFSAQTLSLSDTNTDTFYNK